MGEHFWPSMYPGLIVGLMYGLYAGGWRNAAVGTAGGLAGSLAVAFLLPSLMLQDGILPLFVLLGGSLLMAYCLVAVTRRVVEARETPKG
jgi:hypothetical protein